MPGLDNHPTEHPDGTVTYGRWGTRPPGSDNVKIDGPELFIAYIESKIDTETLTEKERNTYTEALAIRKVREIYAGDPDGLAAAIAEIEAEHTNRTNPTGTDDTAAGGTGSLFALQPGGPDAG